MTRLLLCRHAPAGDEAAVRRLAEDVRTAGPHALYTSPLERARATARAISAACGDLEAREVPALREIDLGDVEGLGFDELPAELRAGLLATPTSVRFPGGEGYADLKHRVVTAVAAIVRDHPGEVVAVVSHAGAIRAALASWLLVPDEAVFRIDQRPAAVNVVDWYDGIPLARLVNGVTLQGV